MRTGQRCSDADISRPHPSASIWFRPQTPASTFAQTGYRIIKIKIMSQSRPREVWQEDFQKVSYVVRNSRRGWDVARIRVTLKLLLKFWVSFSSVEISTFKIELPGVRRANAFYDFSRASDGPRQKQRKFCVRVRCQSSIRTSLTQTFLLAKLLHRVKWPSNGHYNFLLCDQLQCVEKFTSVWLV